MAGTCVMHGMVGPERTAAGPANNHARTGVGPHRKPSSRGFRPHAPNRVSGRVLNWHRNTSKRCPRGSTAARFARPRLGPAAKGAGPSAASGCGLRGQRPHSVSGHASNDSSHASCASIAVRCASAFRARQTSTRDQPDNRRTPSQTSRLITVRPIRACAARYLAAEHCRSASRFRARHARACSSARARCSGVLAAYRARSRARFNSLLRSLHAR